MRDNDAPFIALSVAKTFPATRLIIRDEKFAVPISPRDGKFLATHLGNGSASRHTVAAAEVIFEKPSHIRRLNMSAAGKHWR